MQDCYQIADETCLSVDGLLGDKNISPSSILCLSSKCIMDINLMVYDDEQNAKLNLMGRKIVIKSTQLAIPINTTANFWKQSAVSDRSESILY